MSALFTLVFFSAFCQKVDYDKNTQIISVDGVDAFKVDRVGCGFADADCYYNVMSLGNEKLFKVYYRDFKSPVEVSRANPQGMVRYLEFVFTETRQKAEVDLPGIKAEKVGRLIVKNELIKDGKLDQKAVDDFVFASGTPFSDRVKF